MELSNGEVPSYKDLIKGAPPTYEGRSTAIAGKEAQLLASLPELSPRISDWDIVKGKQDTYRLQERPSIDLLQQLPAFNGLQEVSIYLIDNFWILEGGIDKETYPSDMIVAIKSNRGLKMNLHSHPRLPDESFDPLWEQPSDKDIDWQLDTIDGYGYIAAEAGLLEYRRGWTKGSSREHWEDWIKNVKKMSLEEYKMRGAWNVKRDFFRETCGLRVIPWENSTEIDGIIAQKEALPARNKQ